MLTACVGSHHGEMQFLDSLATGGFVAKVKVFSVLSFAVGVGGGLINEFQRG